jgi:predicted ATPase
MGLNLKYTLENIGNIDKATVTIKPLTIIAGENSCGKTFVTKSLYTILNAIYKDHFSDQLIDNLQSLDRHCHIFMETLSNPAKIDLAFNHEYLNQVNDIKMIIKVISKGSFENQSKVLEENKKKLSDFNQSIKNYFTNRKQIQKFSKYAVLIDSVLTYVDDMEKTLNNRVSVIIESINSSLDSGFKKNYQITNLQSLIKRGQKESLKISIDEIGNIEIDNQSIIKFKFDAKGIQKVQNVQNIVFFDSPVYIKIRKALEKKNTRFFDFLSSNDDKYLKGYPEYLEQLYNYVDKEYIDISDFDEISKEIQSIISGKLDISKSGDISYSDEQGNSIPLSLTAMGISNIGLIDLLLRNNVINKGSFLIMDEPEAHLHPKWQVELAYILYKIAKHGANIILATHSLDLLKAFQTILKDDPETANEIMAINKIPFNNDFLALSEREKIDTVLDDLSKPYYDLYMKN